jgi:hypothetical protein
MQWFALDVDAADHAAALARKRLLGTTCTDGIVSLRARAGSKTCTQTAYNLGGTDPRVARLYDIGSEAPGCLVGDGSYATHGLMTKAVACKVGLIVRMKMNSCLYYLQPSPVKDKRGLKLKKGKRVLRMKARLTDKRIKWREVMFLGWYTPQNKTMLITTGPVIWSSGAKREFVHIRWVLVKESEGKMESVLISCMDLNISEEDVVCFFVRRS